MRSPVAAFEGSVPLSQAAYPASLHNLQEPATLSNDKLSQLGCAKILARPLGYFKIEVLLGKAPDVLEG